MFTTSRIQKNGDQAPSAQFVWSSFVQQLAAMPGKVQAPEIDTMHMQVTVTCLVRLAKLHSDFESKMGGASRRRRRCTLARPMPGARFPLVVDKAPSTQLMRARPTDIRGTTRYSHDEDAVARRSRISRGLYRTASLLCGSESLKVRQNLHRCEDFN